MYRTALIIFLLVLLTCCRRDKQALVANVDTKAVAVAPGKDSSEVIDYFCDSGDVGDKEKSKIELTEYHLADSFWVVIDFYARSNGNGWIRKNRFEFQKDAVMPCDPYIGDFNNDGFLDFTYRSAMAARGANEVRRLFIYDKQKDELTYIVNSEEFPNIRYNRRLDCVDAFLVYGGSSTVFAHIDGDSLVRFAAVDLDAHINVYLIDRKGHEKYLVKDGKNDFGAYIRFRNFNPLQVYHDD